MARSARGEVVLPASAAEAAQLVRRALSHVDGEVRVDATDRFVVRTAASGRSYGEDITVEIVGPDDHKIAQIESRSIVRSTVIDFGRNRGNVQFLVDEMARGASDDPRRAPGSPIVNPRVLWFGLPLCGIAALGAVFAKNNDESTRVLLAAAVAAICFVAAMVAKVLGVRRRGQVTPLRRQVTAQVIDLVLFLFAWQAVLPLNSGFGVRASLGLSCAVAAISVTAMAMRVITARTRKDAHRE